jgi:phosphatidate phosphatase APP1
MARARKKNRTGKPPPAASLYQKLKLRAEAAAGILDPLEIVPFRGFGDGKTFVLEGRLLEQKGVSQPTDDTGILENVVNAIRRLDSDEIPDALVRATFRGRRYEGRTDREGYFSFRIDGAGASRPGWHTARVELVESMVGQAGLAAKGKMLLPSSGAEYAIVSDIDDTIVATGSFDRATMARVVLSKNARTRVPFPGVARLYRALEKGADGRRRNPVFYVSRTGWNLYDLFEAFLDLNDLPAGPILLRDLSIFEKASEAVSGRDHKVRRIEQILAMYPSLPLVLIGDSGQEDPETYESIVKKHPTRIRAVYFRDVTKRERDREVEEIVRRIMRRGIPALATEDTLGVAVHAAEAGLLRPSALDPIRAARDAALTGAKSRVFR